MVKMQTFPHIKLPNDFKLVLTGDGSPSLQFFATDQLDEVMHHSAGAFSESLYIYQESLELAFSKTDSIQILSAGLGIGYNEILSVAHSLQKNRPISSLHSYEVIPYLKNQFINWLSEKPSDLTEVYQKILQMSADHYGVESTRIYDQIKALYETKSFMLHDSITEALEKSQERTVIFYDMYSNKMNSTIWSEEFLTDLIGKCAASSCVLSTYAATGTLKRALRTNEFQILDKPGYSGKRQSTLATK
tara:strand:+ start:90792 stop:91532 length:741 start_codon:yes stop_codon:yes gene_type:complete